MRHIWVVAAAAAVLSACQTTNDGGPTASVPQQADVPPNYRAVVRAAVRDRFFDPYSIRDAAISKPIPGSTLAGTTQTVCVRANAKNRMGGYVGRKATVFVFRQGELTRTTDNRYAEATCRNAEYEPFPEIEEGYKPPAGQKAQPKGQPS